MPHKYEREIEEILRNMEKTEPRRSVSDRIRSIQRPPTRGGGQRPPRAARLNLSETLLLLGVGLALLGVIFGFYHIGDIHSETIAGAIAVAALALFASGLIVSWARATRPAPPPVWRESSRESNIVDMNRPQRRGFFSNIATQARILRLRLRYRRSTDR